jgi:hypothetical protein
VTSSQKIAGFLRKYPPAIASQLRAARRQLKAFMPRGFELVYDNYNALAFGFSPSSRPSDAVLSIVGYPKWITLFFLKGAGLPDPEALLEGSGSRVRSIRLSSAKDLLSPEVRALVRTALERASPPFSSAPKMSTVVRSVSMKQRPRRPAGVRTQIERKRRSRREPDA